MGVGFAEALLEECHYVGIFFIVQCRIFSARGGLQ
jgi:hypothetical protein